MSAFGLPVLPTISKISPLVWRVLGLNPGSFTLQGSNTYLLGSGEARILIDSGVGHAGYLGALLECMNQAGCRELSSVLITHWHMDHTGGIDDILKHFQSRPPNVYKRQPQLRGAASHWVNYNAITSSSSWICDGVTVRPLITPGHTADHTSFILEEENAIFTGDCVLGHGTTVFRSLFDFTRSLHELNSHSASRFYPGHGEVVSDPTSKIAEYLHHRNHREQQLYTEIAKHPKPVNAHFLVEKVYPRLSEPVRLAALQNVTLHLEKLAHEGKVECENESAMVNIGPFDDRNYSEDSESTADMIQRKAVWLWKAI